MKFSQSIFLAAFVLITSTAALPRNSEVYALEARDSSAATAVLTSRDVPEPLKPVVGVFKGFFGFAGRDLHDQAFDLSTRSDDEVIGARGYSEEAALVERKLSFKGFFKKIGQGLKKAGKVVLGAVKTVASVVMRREEPQLDVRSSGDELLERDAIDQVSERSYDEELYERSEGMEEEELFARYYDEDEELLSRSEDDDMELFSRSEEFELQW